MLVDPNVHKQCPGFMSSPYLHCNEATLSAHELHQADAIQVAARLHLGRHERGLRLCEAGLKAKALVDLRRRYWH